MAFSLTLPEVRSREIVFEEYIQVQKDLLVVNSDEYAYYSVHTTEYAAVILASTRDGKFVVTEEYRHPTAQVIMGFPGGLVEKGESPSMAAKRELLEETGYTAESFEVIGSAYPMAGLCSQKHFYVHAKNAYLTASPKLESSEILQTKLMDEKTLWSAIYNGENLDGAMLASLCLLKKYCKPETGV